MDAKTIVFTFPLPHADTPFVMALPTSSPVPAAKDTGTQYDNRPFSSGPCKVLSYDHSAKLTLVRNTHWNAETDPIRHDYPDSYVVEFTNTAAQATELLLADQGSARSALTFRDASIPADLYPTVVADGHARERLLTGYTQFVWMLIFNTRRVTDVNVRKAMNFALDREGLQKIWGAGVSEPATTILSPIFDGRAITPTGNLNVAYMDDAETNTAIDEIHSMVDLNRANQRWGALDRDIMTRVVPIVPMLYDRQTTVYGSKIGGIYLSAPNGNTGLNNLYVK